MQLLCIISSLFLCHILMYMSRHAIAYPTLYIGFGSIRTVHVPQLEMTRITSPSGFTFSSRVERLNLKSFTSGFRHLQSSTPRGSWDQEGAKHTFLRNISSSSTTTIMLSSIWPILVYHLSLPRYLLPTNLTPPKALDLCEKITGHWWLMSLFLEPGRKKTFCLNHSLLFL